MEKRQHVLPLLSLNGRELWIQALLPLQMGQNQRTEELAQFLHQIGTRRNGHTTLVMPLKLHQKMICPVVGLRAGQHTGAALIRQMDIQSHSADKESVMIYFFENPGPVDVQPGQLCLALGGQRIFCYSKALKPPEDRALRSSAAARLPEQSLRNGLSHSSCCQLSKFKMLACV